MTHGDMNLPLQPASPSWINHLQRALVEGGGEKEGAREGRWAVIAQWKKRTPRPPSPYPPPPPRSPQFDAQRIDPFAGGAE